MGIYKVKDRRGKRRYVVSKYWPNGSGRLRKYAPNYRNAQALQTRVEPSILDGTWKQLKQELAGGNRTIWTVRSFYERFFEEYCKPRIRCLRRYALECGEVDTHPLIKNLAKMNRLPFYIAPETLSTVLLAIIAREGNSKLHLENVRAMVGCHPLKDIFSAIIEDCDDASSPHTSRLDGSRIHMATTTTEMWLTKPIIASVMRSAS